MVRTPPMTAQTTLNETLPTTENRSSPKSVASTKDTKSNWARVRDHLKGDISLEHADIPIIACCLVSGLCDSSAYNAWTCFVSMQTGNTIFLALGASDQPLSHPDGWLKSLTSILFFMCGCLFFAQTRHFSPKARGCLAASFFIQSSLIIIAAALVQAGVVPSPKGLITPNELLFDAYELLPLGFLAFQSGGQIVTSRLLGFNEVPTTVLTSVYCDLMSDPLLLRKENVKRNRRAAAVVSILTGGIAGGWISRSDAGLSASLWIAAAIKMVIAMSWVIWAPQSATQLD